jgi:integrase/recombinase XerD
MGEPQARRTVALRAPRKLPRVLTLAEMQAILDACDRLRDRFLFGLLHETGIFSAGHPLRRKLISAFAQLRG